MDKKTPEPTANADSDLGVPSTDRSKAFRKKLQESPAALERWEIVASRDTKARVRAISLVEGLTPGVAAEALLGLGIEAYASSLGMDMTTLDQLADPEQRQAVLANRSQAASHLLPTQTPSAQASAGPEWDAGAARSMGFAAPSMDPTPQGVYLGSSPLVKSLATYSSRTSPSEGAAENTPHSPPPPASASAMLQGLFDRSKTRKQR